jgi:ElaB/YqjD/DUF883 family membrane-anchored ribosome-binding protein
MHIALRYKKTQLTKGSEMAANQTRDRRNKQTYGQGAPYGQQEAAERSEREESSSVYDGIGDMAEQASEYVTESAEHVQEYIREHSTASVMTSLVAGFGIGLLIGHAIGAPQHEPRSLRYRRMAEGFGNRLVDRIEAMIPIAIAEHFSK